MDEEAVASRYLEDHRFVVELHPDLIGEHGASPPIVVPSHQMHRHPMVHQFPQKTERAGIPSGDHAAVLEPEVEKVSIDDQNIGPLAYPPEPLMEGPNGTGWDSAKMDIAGDEARSLVHGKKVWVARAPVYGSWRRLPDP